METIPTDCCISANGAVKGYINKCVCERQVVEDCILQVLEFGMRMGSQMFPEDGCKKHVDKCTMTLNILTSYYKIRLDMIYK